MPLPQLNTESLFDRSIPEPNTGCWLWERGVNRQGYGKAKFRGESWGAHRLSLFLHTGEDPTGRMVLHSCDQPSCINPGHLRCGDHFDNMDDREKRGRTKGAVGEKQWASKLNEGDIRSILADPRQGVVLAPEYNVHPVTIYRIRRRKIWKSVA